MNAAEVFITCAITGAADSASKSPHIPVTPQQIADSALAAYNEGAAIVHLHVRDPATGKPSRSIELFRETVALIRAKNDSVILNLTGGIGGDLVFGSGGDPLKFAAGTDFVGPAERVAHVIELGPELASLDCGSLNFDEMLYGTTPSYLRQIAQAYRSRGVKPELEVFELGHIELAAQLIREGHLDAPALFQFCLGIKYGAPATTEAMVAMRRAVPEGSRWSAFGLGRMQMPMVAQSVLLGGNVRVGLEDNLYLEKGVLATNAQLVERARRIIESIGGRVVSAEDTRKSLELPTRRT